MWEIGYPIASSKLKRKVMIASYLTTPSPASCVKVDHSLLFSICFCHLTSKIVIHNRKPSSYSTHLRFPSWSWDFCCRSNAWLGFILTFDRKIDLQGILPKIFAANLNTTGSPSGVGLGPVGTASGFLSSLDHQPSKLVHP